MGKYSQVIVVMLFLVACGKQQNSEPSTGDLSRIIGDNDLVQVDASFDNARVIKSIGRLRLGCTVTHVGRGLVATAGHCFFDSPFETKIEHQGCSEAKFDVEWGVLADRQSYLVSHCKEIVAAEYRGGVDYTIFRVEPYPLTFVAVNPAPVGRGERISIFSHPRRRPLEWSGFCEIKRLSSHGGSQIGYECDTDGGSSGAAVLNEHYEMIGIHNFYNSIDNLNGGTMVAKTPLSQLSRLGV